MSCRIFPGHVIHGSWVVSVSGVVSLYHCPACRRRFVRCVSLNRPPQTHPHDDRRAVGRETAQTAGNSHFFDMVIGRRCFFSVLGGAWMMSGGAVPIFSGIMRRLRRAEAQRFPDFLSHALPQLDVGSGGWDVLSRFRPACPPRGSGRRLAMRPPDNLTKRDKEGDRGRGMNFWYNWLYFVRAPAFSKIQPGRR